MIAAAAAFGVVTVLAIVEPAGLPLPLDSGGAVRSAALGLVLAIAAGSRLWGSRLEAAADPAAPQRPAKDA
jgi:hypothetical protein